MNDLHFDEEGSEGEEEQVVVGVPPVHQGVVGVQPQPIYIPGAPGPIGANGAQGPQGPPGPPGQAPETFPGCKVLLHGFCPDAEGKDIEYNNFEQVIEILLARMKKMEDKVEQATGNFNDLMSMINESVKDGKKIEEVAEKAAKINLNMISFGSS